MIRSEQPFDKLIARYMKECAEVNCWQHVVRLKWLLQRELSVQTNEDDLVTNANKVKGELYG